MTEPSAAGEPRRSASCCARPLAPGRGRRRQPGVRRRRTARPRPRHHPRAARPGRPGHRRPQGDLRRAGPPPRHPRAAPAPDRHGRLPPRRAASSARGSSCPGPRPSCSRAGRSSGPDSSGRTPGRGRPVHRLGGDRARASPTRSRAPEVHAVELDPAALRLGRAQPGRHRGRPAPRRHGRAFHDLDGTVDVVVCNPPYIPLEAFESVAPEARDHDPTLALWSGDDGLDAMRVLEATAARLLRPGGWVGAEHADVQGESATRRLPRRRSVGRRPRPPRTWQVVRATWWPRPMAR